MCLSFFYPLFWGSQLIVAAAPLLIGVVFKSARITGAEINYFSVFLVSSAQTQSPILVTVAVIITTGALVALALGGFVVLSWLCLVLPAYLAGSQMILDAVFVPSQLHVADWLALLCSLGATVAGLRLAVRSLEPTGYWTRLGSLAASFVVPVTLLFCAILLRPGVTIWVGRPIPPILAVLLHCLLACVAAGLAALARPRPGRVPAPLQWKTVAWGITTTLVFLAIIPGANAWAHRARIAWQQASLAAFPRMEMGPQYPKLFFQRGISLLIEGEGNTRIDEWVEPKNVAATLDALTKYAINAIALVSYGKPEGPEAGLLEAIASMAHQRGMKVMLKPQVWGPRAFPGTIDVLSSAERRRWFEEYRALVEHYARLGTQMHADLFCVGTEFVRMSRFETEWRDLIARARELYPGPLVYAATQGPEFETIRFWDALDYIGLDNYYPLPDDLVTDRIMKIVEEVHERYKRPVIFTEAGFSSYSSPHKAPWDETPRSLAPDQQALCYEAVFRAFYDKPWFQGVYWWKIDATGTGGGLLDGSLNPWGKPAMEVIKRWYSGGGR